MLTPSRSFEVKEEEPVLICVSERTIEKMKDQEAYDEYLRDLTPKRRGRLTEESEALIRERVARLPRKERLATYLYFWEDASLQNIADTLKISTVTVDKLINNALVRLGCELQHLIYQKESQPHMEVAA